MKPCIYPNCDGFQEARGLCAAHMEQQRRGQALRPVNRRGPYASRRDGLDAYLAAHPQTKAAPEPVWVCLLCGERATQRGACGRCGARLAFEGLERAA